MKVEYSPLALQTLRTVAKFIEMKNTDGSGRRWIAKLIAHVESYAKPNVAYSHCKHHTLARYQYQCITYGDWVIAFRISGDKFNVRRIIHGSRLA